MKFMKKTFHLLTILTKFIYDKGTKKEKHKYFVAQIIKNNEDGIINIRCVRNTKHEDIFIFPQIDDTADIKQNDIKNSEPTHNIQRLPYLEKYYKYNNNVLQLLFLVLFCFYAIYFYILYSYE